MAVLAACYALVVLWFFPKWTVDDAYITYRYADNLANHGELAWNVGEAPVEGYTGVLLPLLLAGGIKLGLTPDVFSKIIGVLSFLLGALVIVRAGAFRRVRPGIIAGMLVLYLTLPMMFTHSLSGLETMLFASLLLAGALQLLRALEVGSDRGATDTLLILILLLIGLTRPEGMAFAGIAIGVLALARVMRERHLPGPLLIRVALLFVLPLALYTAWRYWYYDSLLPNTYYVKLTASGDAITIADSLSDLWHRFLAIPTAAAAVLALGCLNGLRQNRNDRNMPAFATAGLALTLGLFLAVVMYHYSRSAPMMNYSFRFLAPYYPLVLLILGLVSNFGWTSPYRSEGKERRVKLLMAVLAIVAIGGQIVRHGKYLQAEITQADQTLRLLRDEHIPVGLFLKERVPQSEWTTVHIDAGAIPYHSRLKTVDFGRLNDATLARNRLSRQEEVEYFYAHNPGALVFTSYAVDSVVHGDQAAAIIADSRFARYSLAARFSSDVNLKYHQLVFLRNDILKPDSLEN